MLLKNKTKKILALALGFVFLTTLVQVGSTNKTLAQGTPGLGSQSVRISSQPSSPGPNRPTTLTVSSFSTNLSKSNISWYENNVKVDEGVGKTSIVITTGDLGEITQIEVVVESRDGVFRSQSTIRPAEVDLIWESSSYVPPWYEGGAWLTSRNTVVFEATPHFVDQSGNRMSSSNLIYTWKKDGRIDAAASGYGKNSFVVSNGLLTSDIEVVVEVESADGRLSAATGVSIPPRDPMVLVYQESPLYGLFDNQTRSVILMSQEEITFTALPFFFTTPSALDSVSYNWILNNRGVVSNQNKTTFKAGNGGGTAQMKIVARGELSATQEDIGTYRIIFGEE